MELLVEFLKLVILDKILSCIDHLSLGCDDPIEIDELRLGEAIF
jgi:hypothetical protein